MARLGSIIAGAMGGAGEQAVDVADQAIEKRDLLEAAKAELGALTYQHELDMRKLREEHKLKGERGEDRYVSPTGGKGALYDTKTQSWIEPPGGVGTTPGAEGLSTEDKRLVDSIIKRHTTGKGSLEGERTDWDAVSRALQREGREDLSRLYSAGGPGAGGGIDVSSPEYKEAQRLAQEWISQQAGLFSTDASDFGGYGGNRAEAERAKTLEFYQQLKGGGTPGRAAGGSGGSGAGGGGQTYVGKDKSGKTITITWQMIQETAQKHGKTPEEVIADLNLQPRQ